VGSVSPGARVIDEPTRRERSRQRRSLTRPRVERTLGGDSGNTKHVEFTQLAALDEPHIQLWGVAVQGVTPKGGHAGPRSSRVPQRCCGDSRRGVRVADPGMTSGRDTAPGRVSCSTIPDGKGTDVRAVATVEADEVGRTSSRISGCSTSWGLYAWRGAVRGSRDERRRTMSLG